MGEGWKDGVAEVWVRVGVAGVCGVRAVIVREVITFHACASQVSSLGTVGSTYACQGCSP